MFKPKNLLWPILLLILGFIGCWRLSEHSAVNTFDYVGLNNSLNYSSKTIEQANAKLLNSFIDAVDLHYFNYSCYEQAVKIDAKSKNLLNIIRQAQTSYLKNCASNSPKDIFKQNPTTNLRQQIEVYINFLVRQARYYDTDQLKEMLPIYRTQLIFSSLKPEIAKSIFLAYRINILLSEEAILHLVYWQNMPIIETFDERQAVAIPRKSFAVEGEDVDATLFIAEYNKAINPEIKSSDVYVVKSENGVVSVEKTSTQLGIHTVSGTAMLHTRQETFTRPWSFQYIVIAPGACLSLNKTNRLYKGIPNPVKISVPGYNDDKLSLRSQDAIIEKTSIGCYNVTPSKNAKFQYLFVDAINQKGEKSTVAGLRAILSDLPAPRASITGITDGVISYDQFLSEPVLNITPIDADIDPQHYKLVSYEFTVFKNSKEVTEPISATEKNFSDNDVINESMRNLHAGDKILISDIHCTDASGYNIEVPSIAFSIK